MRTLRVLGGLWLDDGSGPSSGRGAQRRRLALLTLLSLSPGRRITRDKAIATLWPENTSTEGRRRLSSAVYDLRRLLGDDAIESAGDELWIAPDAALLADVDDFETALARGDADAAVAAYRGPLLDGVHLSDAAEFEEWIATRRDRLHRQFLQALEQAALARSARGDHRGAVLAALQLVDLEPLSGHAALVGIDALVAAGDRARALTVADAHAARVRRELGVEPDEAILDATRRLRAGSVQRPPSTIAPISFDRQQLVSPDVASVAPAAPAARRPPTRTISSILWRGSAAAALLVAVIAGVAFSSRGSLPKHHAAGASSYTGIVAAAATSTRSSPALRAFVDGEDAYGNGRYDAAVKFFRAALVQDSTFALAHYRLSESMLWQEEPDGFAAVHDSLALRWSSKLSDEDRRLIRGYVAWRRGEYEVADTLDRSVIRADGNNVEAQFQFGEVLFHYNPLRGRSIGEAGGWFDHLLALDSTNWGARWHLLLLDASRIGPSAFHDRVAQLLDAKPDGHLAAELRLFAADRDELPRLASTATSAMLFDAAWRRAVFRRDLAGAETLLTRMTMRGRNEYDHSLGSFAIAALRFGRGSVTTAIPMLEIDEAKRVSAGDAPVILVHGLLANHADTAVDLDSLGRAIERWRQTLAGFDRPTSTPPIVADYLEGLLAVARGDTARARQAAMALEDLDRRHDPNLSPEFRRPANLAHTIRAYGDFRSGRCESALRELDAEKGVYWLGVIASSPLASQSFERYVRAECLLSLGRSAEAVTWFESLEQGTLYDLEFLAASLQGQAQAHRAIGDADATRAIEQRLAELRTK